MKIFNFFKMCATPIEGSTENAAQPNSENATIANDATNNAETQTSQAKASTDKVKVHNLIILDESGSMMSIYKPALDGVNETLQTIRGAQEEHPEQEHFVTLVTFDTGHFNQIYRDTPAAKASDIKTDQYRPNGGTPLYDAMGRSINELRSKVAKEDIVLVTIITDGYENASHEYDGKAIKSLVEAMRAEGWVFTYIGANQDVDAVAESMAIKHRMAFSADEASTKAMFEKERMARKKFHGKISQCFSASAGRFFSREDLDEGYFD